MPVQQRRAPLSLTLVLLLSLAGPAVGGSNAAPAAGTIRLNQLGFLPQAQKLAVVESPAASGFEVLREGDQAPVLSGTAGEARHWAPAGRDAALLDLSQLSTPGTYRLRMQDGAISDPFEIGERVYADVADAALKSYYLGRSGTALEAAHAGVHARAAGHPDTEVEIHPSAASAQRPAGSTISAPGGWYDAGDYNKYIVNSGITTYTLLAAWEDFPEVFRGRDLGIPESGNAVPDILDEAWWNLRWMLAMQDPHDGGVYHKLTNLAFDGLVMPEAARQRRYVVQKSTAAALDFAAVMAVASRVYAPFEPQFPGLPARMRDAALQAWAWAQANPAVVYAQPADVHTGAYGDRGLSDEFAWAAAELYLLTDQQAFLSAFERHAAPADVPGWAQVGSLGWSSLLRHRERLPASLRARVEASIEALASQLAARGRASAWALSMEESDFVWGSSAQALNQAMMLAQGYRLSGRREWLDLAQSQLDYVLGRNPLGISFVTGYGLRTPMHIHHRPSEADGIAAPLPGFLSGGPNPRQQDLKDCKDVTYPSSLPALSWIDHGCSYASNEVAINWNAPLVYVLAAIEALTPGAAAAR